MKLHESLAQNHSIRLQAEAETAGGGENRRRSAGGRRRGGTALLPAILDGVAQHGPYFVIAPGLAMPHGRPEEGVKNRLCAGHAKETADFQPRR